MPLTRRSQTKMTEMLCARRTVTVSIGPRTNEAHYCGKGQCHKEETKENVGTVNGVSRKRQMVEQIADDTKLRFKDEDFQTQPSPRKCPHSDSVDTSSKDKSLNTGSLMPKNANSFTSVGVSSVNIMTKSEMTELDTEEDEVFSYEKLRLKNLRDNTEFLASLGIQKAKQELQSQIVKPKKDKVYQKQKISRDSQPQEPVRRSLRVQNLKPCYVAETHTSVYTPAEHSYIERHPPGPLVMTSCLFPSMTEDLHHKLRDSLKSVSVVESGVESLTSTLKSFMEKFRKIRLSPMRVLKVVKERIFSLAIHPSLEKILVAAGDKWGNLGFWDVESVDDAVTAYSPHTSPINRVEFSPWNPARVFTCSYDGTFRCGDFEEAVFQEIYSVPADEDIMLRAFAFQSENVLAVAQSDGCVAIVDQRTPGTSAENIYLLHNKGLRALDVHPTEKEYFITGSVDGSVCLWDMRKMKSKANVALATLRHGRSVDSACFSPITGNKILSCSSDNTVNLFDSSTLSRNISRTHSIKHNNYVGRWLTKFRAVWHPTRDDIFVIGSMAHPRQIEIFSDTGKLLEAFTDDNLNSVCSINVIHPHRNVLVGGNSSGRVHVFM